MKISFRDIDRFIKKPPDSVRAILVYGPDYGLMKDRVKALSLCVVEDIHDPFNVAALSSDILNDDPARLHDEAFAISMTGGQRLIRVEDANDKITALAASYLDHPNTQSLVLFEGGDLGPRSSLRKLFEKKENAAALPCYVEDARDLNRLIRQEMENNGLRIEPDAVSWLALNIAGDRRKVMQEIEKIILYKLNTNTPVSLQDAEFCCNAVGSLSLDDLVYAFADRNTGAAITAYNTLMADGVSFMVVIRALQNHIRRLHITKTSVNKGQALEQAIKNLSPPVFFKRKNDFIRQVNNWNNAGLLYQLEKLNTLEKRCKSTGMPVETLCAQILL